MENRMLKSLIRTAAVAGLILGAAATGTSAAPLSSAPNIAGQSSGVETVHWRSWRHCHWRNGERFCHGGRRDGLYRGDGPGIYLNFGNRRHHGPHHGMHKNRIHRKH
jgi:hypothetical protein